MGAHQAGPRGARSVGGQTLRDPACGYRSLVSKNGWKCPPPARVARIRDRLRELYGIPRMAPHGRPLDELILTVLSQSTNDRNRDVAFLRLRERFAKAG